MTDTLVMLAGQSNALGFGNNGPAPYVNTARVQIWVDTNGDKIGDAFNYMNPGVNTGIKSNPLAWGPEVEFAKAWLEANPEGTLFIGKVTEGSTGLAQRAGADDWSPASDGELFDKAKRVALDMQSNLGRDHLDGVLYMQGETDGYDQADAGAYHDNFADFLSAVRSEWRGTEVVAGRIAGAPPYAADVRYAQWLLDQEDDHLTTFRTLDFGMQADGLHYDAAGQVSLGRAFFDGWAAQ